MSMRYLHIFAVLLTLLFPAARVFSQVDTIGERYYLNGNPKIILLQRRGDTTEYRSYFRNGHIKDSLFFIAGKNHETPVGVNKTYHQNGRLATYVRHGKNPAETTTWEYNRHGQLKYFEQKPTGVIKYFNRNGRQVREYDIHKMTHIRISKYYRKGRHLKSTSFEKRIKTRKAFLVDDEASVKIKAGALISIITKKDTNSMIKHCLVAGFSADSIYLSKFYYNEKYDRVNDHTVMRYSKTFAFGFNQLRSILYTKGNTGRRRFTALILFNTGLFCLVAPLALIPSTLRDLNAGEADLSVTAITIGAAEVFGLTLTGISKALYRGTVPKKYDLRRWQIEPKL